MADDTMSTLAINTIRTLSMDPVQQAHSGHPGTPMALVPLVYTLWNRVMNFDPEDPIWPNRDRFILSNGHASMHLWSILHLTGVKAVNADHERLGQPPVTLDDIRRFRQFDTRAPGHREYHRVSGVETTTGPLIAAAGRPGTSRRCWRRRGGDRCSGGSWRRSGWRRIPPRRCSAGRIRGSGRTSACASRRRIARECCGWRATAPALRSPSCGCATTPSAPRSNCCPTRATDPTSGCTG